MIECGVRWSTDGVGEPCHNEATHWASGTDNSNVLFKICALHVQSVRDLVYLKPHGMRSIGEPLWVCQEIK